MNILAVGAHPDDVDIKAAGTAAKWCALGHVVKLVSVCDGSAGHQSEWGPALLQAARPLGPTYEGG